MHRQQGMIVMVPIVLLLGIVAASCTVTLQSLSLMSRFSQHVQHSLLLRSEREQQLQHAVTLAKANTHKNLSLALPANMTLQNKAQRMTRGVLLTLYEFSYTQHHMQGGLAVLNFPLIRNIPPAGLMLFTSLASGSGVNIALMPALLAGQSRSLWSRFDVSMHGARKTCLVTSPLIAQCTAPLLSGNGIKGIDVHDASSDFPVSASHFLFGPSMEMPVSTLLPGHVTCSALNSDSHGFYQFQDNCDVPAGHHIGSPANPVLLIVRNASINLAANSRIFGLVVSMTDTGPAPAIKMQAGAFVHGAMMVTHATTSDSRLNIIYDQSLLLNLQNSERLQTGKIIKGSWRDF
ncbi:hypothetical protein [Salinimonas lutimaris]|uniref:hypothetical protein n=1 Tax=Salinimonas lutimaris TaxID=914153 RepID=UPI0010BFD77C|nr:hypothetical protein [Salinimonas lutimaris]